MKQMNTNVKNEKSENHNPVLLKKENIKVNLCPLTYERVRGRAREGIGKKDDKHKLVGIVQCSFRDMRRR